MRGSTYNNRIGGIIMRFMAEIIIIGLTMFIASCATVPVKNEPNLIYKGVILDIGSNGKSTGWLPVGQCEKASFVIGNVVNSSKGKIELKKASSDVFFASEPYEIHQAEIKIYKVVLPYIDTMSYLFNITMESLPTSQILIEGSFSKITEEKGGSSIQILVTCDKKTNFEF